MVSFLVGSLSGRPNRKHFGLTGSGRQAASSATKPFQAAM